ncbi:hypothetical protein NMY22_g13048 [Coprinellus aureogranulatus]|nr:hypothetical protein NMY22_g13048 [Coprinellus aureogranulatus]
MAPIPQIAGAMGKEQDGILAQIVGKLPEDPFRRCEVYGQMFSRYLVHLFDCPPRLPKKHAKGIDIRLHKLSNFVWYLLYRTGLPTPVIFSSLILVHRVKCIVEPHDTNDISVIAHRIILSTTMLAAKYLMENTYDNKSWRLASGQLFTLKEVNKMERDMCELLDWDLTIDKQMLEDFALHFMHDFGKARRSYPIYPLSMVSKRNAIYPDVSPHPFLPDSLPSSSFPLGTTCQHDLPACPSTSCSCNSALGPSSMVDGMTIEQYSSREEPSTTWRGASGSPSLSVPPDHLSEVSPASIPLPRSSASSPNPLTTVEQSDSLPPAGPTGTISMTGALVDDACVGLDGISPLHGLGGLALPLHPHPADLSIQQEDSASHSPDLASLSEKLERSCTLDRPLTHGLYGHSIKSEGSQGQSLMKYNAATPTPPREGRQDNQEASTVTTVPSSTTHPLDLISVGADEVADNKWYCVTSGSEVGAIRGWHHTKAVTHGLRMNSQNSCDSEEHAVRQFVSFALRRIDQVVSHSGKVWNIPGIDNIDQLREWVASRT